MRYNFTKQTHFGKYTVKIDPARSYGYFEHDGGGEGGLWFEGNTLVDSDGTYELPCDVGMALESLGYVVPDAFWPDRWQAGQSRLFTREYDADASLEAVTVEKVTYPNQPHSYFDVAFTIGGVRTVARYTMPEDAEFLVWKLTGEPSPTFE